MGSEHYCLRWNNHQSNLLGVFSQLLQDESLVDVTLACSEGAPIRAHKVVLSACSSYFQSLFLDHPEKHPIVILKDVRFAELQTLVEFMYKGEVNVQYCQLSALLKTAESLKVKGLAEMTNQNQTLREPEREPERLRPHSQPSKGSSSSCDSPVDATLSGTSGSALVAHSTNSSSSNNNNSSNLTLTTTASLISATTNANNSTTTLTTSAASVVGSKRSTEQQQQQHHHHHHQQHDRCSPSPPKRLLHTPKSEQQHHHQRHVGSPLPLDLYQRRLEQEQEQASKENLIVNNNNSNNNNNNNTNEKQQQQQRSTTPQTSTSGTTAQKHSNSNEGASERKPHDNDGDDDDQSCFRSPERSSPRQGYHQQHHHSHRTGTSASGGIDKPEDMDDIDYADEEMDLDEDADNSSEVVGLNMKIRPSASSSLAAALVSPNLHTSREERRALLEEAESARSTPLTASGPLALDHLTRPLSRSSREGSGLDRPNSRGGLGGLPSTSLSSLTGAGGCLSPASSAAAALGLSSDVLAGPSGLGPVQSVPLSLKKEIDCSEDDNSSNSRHLQPRSASASGVLGGEFDYRTSHESLLRNFGMPARCPTPFAFPFTPLGLSLFDIDPSRILTMLHHQTWLAEEALRHRGLLTPPPTSKDFQSSSTQRFNPLSDLLISKEFHQQAAPSSATASTAVNNHSMHLNTADLLARSTPSNNSSCSNNANAANDLTNKQQHRSIQQQLQYKQQQHPAFNIRYPSPAAFFQHHYSQQQQPATPHKTHHQKHGRQTTPSPLTSITSTGTSSLQKALERSLTPSQKDADNDSGVLELTTMSAASAPATPHHHQHHHANPHMQHHDEAAAIRDRDSGNSSAATTSSITSSMLYKDSLEQLLQRRHSSTSLAGEPTFKTYSQLLMNSSTPTDTSSCKEKSSSSSTSSTPPPAPGTPSQLSHHLQLSRSLLKSPSDTSSLFSDSIEEETRCVVCNANFPNVWLLEQHAALQHPLLGTAYAKHKETNHRSRLPADKLFTCDVCGMQFRYLKSFKKHRLNHALERLHGKKGKNPFAMQLQQQLQQQEQEILGNAQEPVLQEAETGEDLRINIKKEKDEEDQQQNLDAQQQQHFRHEETEDDGEDAGGAALADSMNYPENLSVNTSAAHGSNGSESNITGADGIHSTNKRPRLLNALTPGGHMETDPSSYATHSQHQTTNATVHHQTPLSLVHHHQHHSHLSTQLPGHLAHNMSAMAAAAAAAAAATTPQQQQQHQINAQTAQQAVAAAAAAAANSMNSLTSLNSITSLINADRIPNEQFLGLNPQEASILNFLRVDAQERQQRDKRPAASRFACPFCGKCVRSKENLKLHVRKHTGERPFVCLFCGRAFGGKSDLTRHLRIHTGERPYHCESCGKCFARADYLSKHLTTHIHNAPR